MLAREKSLDQGVSMCKCPYCSKEFNSWKSVRGHIPSCKLNNKTMYIHALYGPININELNNSNNRSFRQKYPLVTANEVNAIHKKLIASGIDHVTNFTKDKAIIALHEWVKLHSRIPISRDTYTDTSLPTDRFVKSNFGSWNNYIKAGGYDISNVSGFGKLTIAKDGKQYRSSLEAYFVDNYLYNKHEYEYEKPYPKGYGLDTRLSDFYLPNKDLYLEIAGGLRSEVVEEKITKTAAAGISLRVLYPRQIYSDSIIL